MGMIGTWRFRLVDSGSSRFINRSSHPPFAGSTIEALAFAERIREHFAARDPDRVEAWSVGPIEVGDSDRELFEIQRHANGHDWRLLESRLTHPGWFDKLIRAVDYAAFRGRGYPTEIRVRENDGVRLVVAGLVEAPAMCPPAIRG